MNSNGLFGLPEKILDIPLIIGGETMLVKCASREMIYTGEVIEKEVIKAVLVLTEEELEEIGSRASRTMHWILSLRDGFVRNETHYEYHCVKGKHEIHVEIHDSPVPQRVDDEIRPIIVGDK